MIEILREFIVKEEARGWFELAFGPGGAWSKLFDRCPGYRGTTLLRDTVNPCRYLVVDFWDTANQREQVLADRAEEYAELEANFAQWTEGVTALGIFKGLAQATVRPVGRIRRGKAGKSR